MTKGVASFLGIVTDEIILHFVTKRKITALHRQFFDDPTPTDCITFPLDEEILGEIFICPQVAIEYAKEHGEDPLEELTLYVVHGMLHLLGYKDIPEKERAVMRREEKRCLAYLQENNLMISSS